MKTQILAAVAMVFLVGFQARASGVNCTGDQFSFSRWTNDGGAHIIPTVQVVLNGKTVVDTGLGHSGTEEVYVSFDGKDRLLKPTVKIGDYKISYFTNDVTVVSSTDTSSVLFKGEVICKGSRYVGVPRP